jgi:hypothetical protein
MCQSKPNILRRWQSLPKPLRLSLDLHVSAPVEVECEDDAAAQYHYLRKPEHLFLQSQRVKLGTVLSSDALSEDGIFPPPTARGMPAIYGAGSLELPEAAISDLDGAHLESVDLHALTWHGERL